MTTKVHSFTRRQHMVRPTYEIYHYRDSYPNPVALHHHDFYEMYLFLEGDVDYVIESRRYRVNPGDILLISPNELHQPMFGGEQRMYERIVLWIDKAYLMQYTLLGAELSRCFDRAAREHTNLVRMGAQEQRLLVTLLKQCMAERESDEFASDMAADTLMVQAMVMLNRMAERGSRTAESREKSGDVVGSVLAFINDHYSEDLSLDLLANRFFISKYHLSREFNRLVGTSVYRYIIQKRLVIAKQLLAEGVPSSEVYQHCGFGDYSNFYRAFRGEYQISPKEYVAKLKQDAEAAAQRRREMGAVPGVLLTGQSGAEG